MLDLLVLLRLMEVNLADLCCCGHNGTGATIILIPTIWPWTIWLAAGVGRAEERVDSVAYGEGSDKPARPGGLVTRHNSWRGWPLKPHPNTVCSDPARPRFLQVSDEGSGRKAECRAHVKLASPILRATNMSRFSVGPFSMASPSRRVFFLLNIN